MVRLFGKARAEGVALAVLAAAGIALAPTWASAQGFASEVAVVGDRVLVADPGAAGPEGGVVRIYARSAGAWTEAGTIAHPDGGEGNGFGMRLGAAGDHVLVTALNQRAMEESGVHAFARDGGGWSHAGRLSATGLPAGMILGLTISMDGDRAAVSGVLQSHPGVVAIFRRADGAWIQEALLEAPDGAAGFGASVDLAGDELLVGAPLSNSQAGDAYVFRAGPEGWVMTSRLSGGGAEGGFFGIGALWVGGVAHVAAGGAQGQSGEVVSFERDGGEWAESGRISAFDGGAGDAFGAAMATDGETLWVAAPGAAGRSGAVYEFAGYGLSGWSSVAKVTAPEPKAGQWAGSALAQSGGVLALGNPRDDYGLGTALIYERDGGGWSDGDLVFVEAAGYEAVSGGELECSEGEASVFGCSQVDLVSFVPVKDLGGARGVRVNDVWGWTDSQEGRDYAIVGRMDGTSFVDVTDPQLPVLVGNLPKPEHVPGSVWRDMKVYSDHVYVVADGAADHGMQVFDLTRLREFSGEPITFDEDAHYDRIHSAHNIVINEETGFAYAVGSSQGGETCGGGLHMIDIRDPKNPTFAGCFAHENTGRSGTGYSHDAQCVTYHGPDETYAGREICLGSNENALSIADVSDKDAPVTIGVGRYEPAGYSHQGWLTDDHAYFYMNDELDEVQGLTQGTRTLIWDVRELADPQLLTQFISENTSSDHNLYIRGNLMYQSNYNSGLRIFDITDVATPREVAFFDTVPGEDFPAMDGSWSNYPFFESGVVLVTSGRQGLFLVRHTDRRPVS